GLSLVLSFAYWMLFSFMLSLGYTGHLPPFFAAWAANILFGGIGIYLAFQIKR
ncbi:MAG: LptF/LptG family permease, partial [Nitrospirae bacterium]|nr:LptF/LptG family permease [Nitrospirota bacterium]